MTSRTQAFVLLLFGVALARLGLSDMLLRFVRPSARPWVLIAAAVFVTLAVWTLVVDARHGDGVEPAVDEHGHAATTRLAWLVISPVVAVLVIAPQALGSFTADRQPSVVAAGHATEHFSPLPAGSPVDVSVYDLASRAVLGGGTTLQGRSLRFIGFVARGSAGNFTLARLVITCCAADASPVFVQVSDPALRGDVRRDSWVRVTGRYEGVSATEDGVPVVRATAVRTVPVPSNPYD